MPKKIGDLRDEIGVRCARRLGKRLVRLPFHIGEGAKLFLRLSRVSVDVRLREPMGVDCSAQLR